MTRAVPFLFVLLLTSFVYSQSSDDLLDAADSLDSLFDEPVTEDTDREDNPQVSEPEGESSVLEDLLDRKTLDIKGNFTLTGGYTPGFDGIPPGPGNFNDSLILELNSQLILDFHLSREFRFYQKWVLEAPDFILDPSEVFADYHPNDTLFLRAGRFNVTWGESRNFSHTNLVARLPEGISGGDILALRLTIPWKTGSVEALSLTRDGFWKSESSTPGVQDFGWGLRINPPLPFADVTLSVFAHPLLNLRSAASVKTTLFDSVEAYGEFLVTVDKDLYYGHYNPDKTTADGKPDNPIDYSLNGGLYRDFLDNRLSLGGEYFFNGEESELTLASDTWSLFYGHNLALYARWKQNDWDLSLYGRYNHYYRSGILGPGFNWYFADGAKLQLGGAWSWGADGYGGTNPDDWNRDALMFIRLVINGSWDTTL